MKREGRIDVEKNAETEIGLTFFKATKDFKERQLSAERPILV
jgi:hypothetical protein